jgi:hypothetical protein
MTNRMLARFLDKQRRDAEALCSASDLVDIHWVDEQRVVVRLTCTGLIRTAERRVVEHSCFDFGIAFGDEHLRYADGLRLISVIEPRSLWHPNAIAPGICIGKVAAGTGIREIVFRLFDVVVYNNLTVDEHDALNHAACSWSRARMDRFPIDGRPVLWRTGDPVPPMPGTPLGGDWGLA